MVAERDQFLHIAGAGAVIVADHHGGRVFHVGQQRHLELSGKDQAEDGDHDDGQQRGHLMLDTKFRSTHVGISPPRLRSGPGHRRRDRPVLR